MEAVLYDLVRLAHVIGAAVLFGTGIGIAFFMLMAHRSGDARHIARTGDIVVIADYLFTATAAILQPITGIILALSVGWDLTEGWILTSLGLYIFVGLFWLPVVWIQIRMRRLALAAAEAGTALPDAYHRLYRIWFAFGFPAFFAVLAIIWLMLTKPDLPL